MAPAAGTFNLTKHESVSTPSEFQFSETSSTFTTAAPCHPYAQQ